MNVLAKTLAVIPLLVALSATAVNMDKLVLVTATKTDISTLSYQQVRQLFLGLPVKVDGHSLRPINNISDERVIETFLQKVILLSRRQYFRRLVSQTFRFGGERPAEYHNLNELIIALRQSTGGVTYMWRDEAEQHPGLKIVAEL